MLRRMVAAGLVRTGTKRDERARLHGHSAEWFMHNGGLCPNYRTTARHVRRRVALPSLLGRHHGGLGTLVILNLPPTVYQGLTADVILAVDALAFLPAHYAALEALAVFLETRRLLALAPRRVGRLRHFFLESIGILRDGIRDSLVPDRLELVRVLTVVALAPVAVLLGREAYAVQL